MAYTTRNTRRVANAAAERLATLQRMRTGGRPMNPRLPADPTTIPQLGYLTSPNTNRGQGYARVGPAPGTFGGGRPGAPGGSLKPGRLPPVIKRRK